MKVGKTRTLLTSAAVLALVVSGVAVTGAAWARIPVCDGRMMKGGFIETTPARQDLYGEAAVPTSGSVSDCRLVRGTETGPDVDSPVYWLQLTLNECYGGKLTLDGAYGAKTRDAVIAAQKAERVRQDGVYGPQTRDRMKFYTKRTQPHGVVKSRCVPYTDLT